MFNLLNPSYLQNEKKTCIFYKLEDIIYRERCVNPRYMDLMMMSSDLDEIEFN